MPNKSSQNQVVHTFLKKGVSPDELEIYNLYIQRIMKHYDLRVTHFTIYFGFQSGLSAVVGYLIQPYIANYPNGISQSLSIAFIGLGVVGALFSIAWILVARNDRTIQLFMNEIIGNMEKEIFENQGLALHLRINAFYSPKSKMGSDVIDINSFIAIIFLIAWFVFIAVFAITILSPAFLPIMSINPTPLMPTNTPTLITPTLTPLVTLTP